MYHDNVVGCIFQLSGLAFGVNYYWAENAIRALCGKMGMIPGDDELMNECAVNSLGT